VKSFSQRKGLKPIKNKMQIESMDADLRNRLWNALTVCYWNKVKADWLNYPENKGILTLFNKLWHNYFKYPLDTLSNLWDRTYQMIRKYFFECAWHEAYSFIEFVANNYPDKTVNRQFMDFCDSVLESEVSAYRFVGGRITQITSEEEISGIEQALATPLTPVRAHLERALDLLSDKKSPDYRNSIKESISAVESICIITTGDTKATLGQCLKEIESKVGLHPALKNAFSNLYGYTSSAEGIRHALLDEPKLSFEDAKFMLVSCSTFVNYLISKASKAGIKLN